MSSSQERSVVVFLGAGASKAYGFPLTSEILPLIIYQIQSKELFHGFKNEGTLRRELRKCLNALLPGLSSKRVRHPMVTDVLSLIDYSLLSGTSLIRGATLRDLTRFRELLEQAIYDVLWPNYDQSPAVLRQLADWLEGLAQQGSTAVITSNYDMSVEGELVERISARPVVDCEERFDFGFTWRDPDSGALRERPRNPLFAFYKLHGSVNWLRCSNCEHTYINLWGLIGAWAFSEQHEHNTCHCGHAPARHVLVAPSLVRDIRDPNLLETWKHALEKLRTADDWYIIGYSFPPEDLSIRSMFVRALHGRGQPPRITVIQHGMQRDTWSRYKVLFPECRYVTGGLEKFLNRERRRIVTTAFKSMAGQ